MKEGTLSLSWGPWGGFYVVRRRIRLGWVALTFVPDVEIDSLLEGYVKYWDAVEQVRQKRPEGKANG